MSLLYHYTNSASFDLILVQSILKPSLFAKRRRDVRYGDGQYFTNVGPGLLNNVQLSLLLVENPDEAYRFTHYFAINTAGLTLTRGREGIFVLRGRENLDLTGRIKEAGRVL